MVTSNNHVDPESVARALRGALTNGCRASRILRYTPELIELLLPGQPRGSPAESLRAEQLIVDAVNSFTDRLRETLLHLVGLEPRSEGFPLKTRRNFACKAFGRDPDDSQAYSTKHFVEEFEPDLVWDLAVAVCQVVIREVSRLGVRT